MASSASDDKVGRDKMLSYIKKQKAKILELESTISALQSRAETENLSSLDANGKNASEKISNSSVSHTEEANQSNDSKKVDDQASVALLEETRKELNMFKNRCEELELGLSESRCQLKEALDSAADSQDIIKDLTEQLSVTKSENARALELAVSRAMAAEEECSRTTKRMADEYAVFQMDAEACYLQRLSAQEKELADALACRNVLESRIVLLEEEKGRLQAELGVSTQEAYRALSDRSNTMADLEAEETVSSEVCKGKVSSLMAEAIHTSIVSPKSGSNPQRKYQTDSWTNRACALFFYFHDALGGGNMELTCKVYGVKHGTFRNWVTKKAFYPKWSAYVRNMKFADVKPSIPDTFICTIEIDRIPLDSTVKIPTRFITNPIIQGLEPYEKKPRLLMPCDDENMIMIMNSRKSIGSGRLSKYRVQEDFLIGKVRVNYELGKPLTRPEIYEFLQKEFGFCSRSIEDINEESEFEIAMKLNSGSTSNAFSQWVTRRLQHHNIAYMIA